MKKLIFTLILACIAQFGMAQDAEVTGCIDFSGTYKDKNDSIITITQVGCVSVVITQGQFSNSLYADGFLRLLQTQDVKNGNVVIGKNRIFGTAKINKERMDVNYEIFTTYLDNSTEEHKMNLYFSLDGRKNLIIVKDNFEGAFESAYFTRQVKK